MMEYHNIFEELYKWMLDFVGKALIVFLFLFALVVVVNFPNPVTIFIVLWIGFWGGLAILCGDEDPL
jgi:hypothetical protein